MNKNSIYQEVATAIRIEKEEKTGDVFIIFKIIDEKFKNQILLDWMQDIELQIIDKKLVRFE